MSDDTLNEMQRAEVERIRAIATGPVHHYPIADLGSIMVTYRIGNKLRRKIVFADGTTHPGGSQRAPDPKCGYCHGTGHFPAVGNPCFCTQG
jgi:hypothetical protein